MTPLIIPKTGDWRHRFEFFGPDGVTPEDISTAIPALVLRRQAASDVVTLTLASGLAQDGPAHTFDVDYSKTSIAAWPAGPWVIDIGLVWPDGYDDAAASMPATVREFGAPADGGVSQVLRQADGTRIIRVASGPPGPSGPPGVSFTHTQSSPSADWTVNHNLGANPVVSVRSAGGVEVEAEVVHTSLNQLHIYLAAPAVGSVRCT